MLKINNEFEYEQIVYLKTDDEQLARMVTGIMTRKNDVIIYELSQGAEEPTMHFEFEICAHREL